MDVATAGSVRRLSRRSPGWLPKHPATTAWAAGAPLPLLTTLLEAEPGPADVRIGAAL
jgi:hypothetical protein